jgi:hypothetical protein
MDRDDLAALIRGTGRPGSLALLLARCWPGGGDRSEPAGRGWVRAWGPARSAARVPACGCATGRCGVCN